MIHVYAIVEALGPAVDLPPGIDGEPVDRIRAGRLLALISRHGRPLGDVTLDRVMAHETVVEAVMSRRAVVPVRYGVHYSAEQALVADLRASAERLDASLELVRGRVELALRLADRTPLGPPESTGRSGRGYLEGRRRKAALTEITDALRGSTVATVIDEDRGGTTAALLIEAGRVDTVCRAVADEAEARRMVGLSLTGPWPPYSFVELGVAT